MDTAVNEDQLNERVTLHMRRDLPSLNLEQTAGEALATLREKQPEGRIIYFYVVDNSGRLCGVVPTRRLLLNQPETRVADIMVRRVVAIPASATVLEAMEFFPLHRFLAFPVVDDECRLVGMVDVDLYTAERADLEDIQRSDDLFQLVGVHLAQARQTAPLSAFRSRLPWLACNVAGGILAAFLSGLYENELQKHITLALFIPVVLALAESVSVQSVSLALQGLHGQTPTLRLLLQKLRWESVTGMLLGLTTGLVVATVALVWVGEFRVALCILGGISAGVTAAAVFGLAMPNVLRLLQRDPKVAAGPVALAIADMLTLLVYFNLARSLLP